MGLVYLIRIQAILGKMLPALVQYIEAFFLKSLVPVAWSVKIITSVNSYVYSRIMLLLVYVKDCDGISVVLYHFDMCRFECTTLQPCHVPMCWQAILTLLLVSTPVSQLLENLFL